MISIKDVKYCPVISTRDAEARGFSELNKSTLDSLLPVMEITRSRRSRTNPDGDIHRSKDRLLSTLAGRPFVIDVSSLGSQSNTQTSELLDPANAFGNWTSFVGNHLPDEAVPVIHLEDPFNTVGFLAQIGNIPVRFGVVALRLPLDYGYIPEVVRAFNSVRRDCVVFIDAAYISESSRNAVVNQMTFLLPLLAQLRPKIFAPLSSSFPSSVLDPGYGQDDSGCFPLSEVGVSEALKVVARNHGIEMVHGDYSTIHPNDFTGTVTNWVPRVDVPLDTQILYHRERRPTGGYIQCAQRMVHDGRYVPISPCWGIDQVTLAATGAPEGRSPAFWISVRLNIHIERQINRLR